MKLRNNPYKEVVKEANKFKPWDFGFIVALERESLKYMLKSFSSDKAWSDQTDNVRHIKLALKCLDIIEGRDNAHILEYGRPALDMSKPVGQRFAKCRKDFMIKYVNCKNFKRFMPKFQKEDFSENLFKNELRERKAWYLYNLIRSYFMLTWWD